MNMLFFPRGSSVVEIYPYHLHHNLYPTLAAHMQIGHYGVYNFNNTDIVTREKVLLLCVDALQEWRGSILLCCYCRTLTLWQSATASP